jgi:hypothetical protein
MSKPKAVKCFTGPGPNDYILIGKAGIEPRRFLPLLRKVFPGLDFTGKRDALYVAAGAARTARLYYRKERDGKLIGIVWPVELVRTKYLKGDVLTWVRCLWEVHDDLGLGLPLFEVIHSLHCLDAGDFFAPGECTRAVKMVTNLYSREGRG